MAGGFDNLSLAFFTTLSPAGVVAFIGASIPLLFFSLDRSSEVKLTRFLAIPCALTLIGFIASATHLGTPSNALHVFSGIGRSPLSNEVFAAILFLCSAGSYWMISFKQNLPRPLAKFWLFFSSLSGIFFIIMTSLAYSVHTVLTWNTPYTPFTLIFSALFSGNLICLLLCSFADIKSKNFLYALFSFTCISLAIGAVFLILHNTSLSGIVNNEIIAYELVPHYKIVIGAYIAIGIIGLSFAGWSLRADLSKKQRVFFACLSCFCALFATFLPRIVFYALYMTAGF